MIVRSLMLAIIFASLQGEFSLANLVGGWALGLLIFAFQPRRENPYSHVKPKNYLKLVSFAAFFIGQLILANLRMARDIMTPGLNIRPGIIAVPLDAKTDAEITVLAQVITLTPGTLSMDVSPDRSTLYVHALYVPNGDKQTIIDEIKNGFERRLLEVMR